MKYCKICKTAAKDTDTVCSKGHALSVFGNAPKAAPAASTARDTATEKPGSTMFTLLGEVRKLEETQKQQLKRGRTLGLLSLAAAIAIMFILYQAYSRAVLAYAVLENVRIEQDPSMDRTIKVTYEVKSPGKLVFHRRSGSRRTEKVDVTTETGPDGFSWTWPSDPKAGIDFSVHYRDGWLRTSEERHFEVADDDKGAAHPGPVDPKAMPQLRADDSREGRTRRRTALVRPVGPTIPRFSVVGLLHQQVSPLPSSRDRCVPAAWGRGRL